MPRRLFNQSLMIYLRKSESSKEENRFSVKIKTFNCTKLSSLDSDSDKILLFPSSALSFLFYKPLAPFHHLPQRQNRVALFCQKAHLLLQLHLIFVEAIKGQGIKAKSGRDLDVGWCLSVVGCIRLFSWFFEWTFVKGRVFLQLNFYVMLIGL